MSGWHLDDRQRIDSDVVLTHTRQILRPRKFAALAETQSQSHWKTARRNPMSSGKSKRFAASSWTAALVLAGMLVPGFGLTTMAQSVAEFHNGLEETWHDGIEGTWREQLTVRDCDHPDTVLGPSFPTIFAYAKGVISPSRPQANSPQ
jgi:hypothetical protein